MSDIKTAEQLRLEREAEQEQERKDLALLAFGCIDHIGDVLVDLESYLERMEKIFGPEHPLRYAIDQAVRAHNDAYRDFRHLLTAGDRLNRYAKPTLYSEAGEREDARAKKRWPLEPLRSQPR